MCEEVKWHFFVCVLRQSKVWSTLNCYLFPLQLRDAQSRLEELETTNNHLIKRFDKLKNARSNLLKDLSQDPA